MNQGKETGTFWDHLDELRSVLLKISIVIVFFAIISFIFKELLFRIVLAPKNEDFITYKWLEYLGGIFSGSELTNFDINLINTELAQQFIIHMKTAFCFGILCASPYIIYQLFRFVSPALYENERRYAVQTVSSGYLMFMIGVMVGYFLIFPLTFRFLGTYQVSGEVINMISLESYMSTLTLISIAMGVVFELPVLSWLLSKMGILNASFMKNYRKHAIVLILILAAVITPTSDIFTLIAVSLPMYLLYEASIIIVAKSTRKKEDAARLVAA